MNLGFSIIGNSAEEGGVVLSYIHYIGMYRPDRVGFLRCSVLDMFGIVILRYSLNRVTKLQYPPQRAKRKRYGLLKLLNTRFKVYQSDFKRTFIACITVRALLTPSKRVSNLDFLPLNRVRV